VPKTPKLARFGGNLVRLGVNEPLFLLRNRSRQLLLGADRLLNRESFDLIHFNHLDTACFALERQWSQKMVFDSHNCLSGLAAIARATVNGRLRKAVLKRESSLLSRVESATCDRMNATLVCSEHERCAFTKLCPTGRYEVIPNGVDTDYFRPGDRDEEQFGAIVFTGAMGYWPNAEAAVYFCRELLPIVCSQIREAKVFFVGKAPPPRVRGLHDGNKVIVTGEVSDVRPYIRQAQVVVVPLRNGAGTRLKILEAFAMGKAVVSTQLGVEGIPAASGREILIADDPLTFATHIAQLLTQPSLRQKLGDAALRFVRERFEWRLIQQQLLNVYGQLSGNNHRIQCA
jgi:glycosyltransferase involved in cell wall biosynthesis